MNCIKFVCIREIGDLLAPITVGKILNLILMRPYIFPTVVDSEIPKNWDEWDEFRPVMALDLKEDVFQFD